MFSDCPIKDEYNPKLKKKFKIKYERKFEPGIM